MARLVTLADLWESTGEMLAIYCRQVDLGMSSNDEYWLVSRAVEAISDVYKREYDLNRFPTHVGSLLDAYMFLSLPDCMFGVWSKLSLFPALEPAYENLRTLCAIEDDKLLAAVTDL